jgi:hypothetical protein
MEQKGEKGMFELFQRNKSVTIYVSETENRAVQIAVSNLLCDIKKVFECDAIQSDEIEQADIVIGTITTNETKEWANKKNLNLEKMQAEDGSYHWEAFLLQLKDEVLSIIGENRRGTIYGIYDLCEQIGVSPWYYWADVPVKVKASFSLPADYCKADWPSVQYRGIFINDEEELNEWAKLHTKDDTIGPEAYEKIFELLLRLKANYIWPAMHVNYFNENPVNNKLADEMGIVVGTSHCDMLLRSNQNEWTPWIESKGYTDAVYDYSIEGQNREILKEYWRECIEQNKDYEVCFTMGMRGIHDSGFITKTIDEDTSLSEVEKKAAKVELLGQVISDQRELLIEVLGEEKGREALQTFVPYKEVLDLYNNGLDLPEDITLIWANDNYGHMRRFPNELERKRSGGSGLYYHASYWAAPGTAMSYLFINSTPLAHTGNELRKSYESGIRKIWVLNIGGLKPVEQDMEYFIHYGWNAGKETSVTLNAFEFTKQWINANFSGDLGKEAAELYETFAQVTNVRKLEHMNNHVFSQTAYGDEAGRRLMKLEEIFNRGNELLKKLPKEEQEAFFQLFLMKIHVSYYTNHEYYYADRSILSYDRGNMQAADRYVELSVKMMNYQRRMLHFYNKKMSDGKWDLMLTPDSFSPPPTALYPVRKPALKIEGSSMRLDIWNEEKELQYSIYGISQKWIELGNQGEGNIPFHIEVKEGKEFIHVSETDGILENEMRIMVSVVDAKMHAGAKGLLIVQDLRNNIDYPVSLQIEEKWDVPENFTGYVEADGYVSIPVEGYQNNISTRANISNELSKDNKECKSDSSDFVEGGFIKVPGLGRYQGAAMMAWNPKLCAFDESFEQNPYLEYQFYLKNSSNCLLEIYRFLTLDSMGRIRFGIGIDDEYPILVESETRDEWIGNWQESVFNNGEKILLDLSSLSQGAHTLRLFMVDNYVTFSKLVIYTGDKKRSNLGPITSKETGKTFSEYGCEMPLVNWNQLEQLCNEFYQTKEEEVPLPNTIYADKEFFEHRERQVYSLCQQYAQNELGNKRYEKFWKSTQNKDILQEFDTGVFTEDNGIVAIEAEYALENSENAYITNSKDNTNISWSHLQAETNGRTGFAMHVDKPALLWEDPQTSPGLHYKVNIQNAGIYHVWMLIRYYNGTSNSCYLALDGEVQPLSGQFNGGNLHTYNTEQVYYWCLMSDMVLASGVHTFSVLARKSELRVDRIFLSQSDELPPDDVMWKDSIRK